MADVTHLLESFNTPPLQPLKLLRGGEVLIQRDDLIDPLISGNKWRKMQGWLQCAIEKGPIERIVTFGGAYSNHMLAVASVGSKLGIDTYVVLRGDEDLNNHYLEIVRSLGMVTLPIPRDQYRFKGEALKFVLLNNPLIQSSSWVDTLLQHLNGALVQERVRCFADCLGFIEGTLIVPEGGRGIEGTLGFEELRNLWLNSAELDGCFRGDEELNIVHASATATTAIGLAETFPEAKIHAVMVLKNRQEQQDEIASIANLADATDNWIQLYEGFEWGGYAKYRPELKQFILEIQELNGSKFLLDPVYTGKAMWALQQFWDTGVISASKGQWVFLHTGGQLGGLH